MNKLWKYTQYGYIVVAIVLLIDAITRWSTDRNQAYFSIVFAVFITAIFFFKRWFRRKIEKKNNERK